MSTQMGVTLMVKVMEWSNAIFPWTAQHEIYHTDLWSQIDLCQSSISFNIYSILSVDQAFCESLLVPYKDGEISLNHSHAKPG